MGKKDLYNIYIIRCHDDSLYTGIAKDWKKRYIEHQEGRGAKYTKSHKPVCIESVWEAYGRSEASKVEWFVKSFSKNKKERILLEEDELSKEVFEKFNIEIKKEIL